MDIFDSLGKLTSNPDGNLMLKYGIGIAVSLVVLMLVKIVMKSMATHRVRSIQAVTEGFGGLSEMRKKGLITEEEYKAARRKMAQTTLNEQQSAEASKSAMQLIESIDANPELAKKLIPESGSRARAAMTGRDIKPDEVKNPTGQATPMAAPPINPVRGQPEPKPPAPSPSAPSKPPSRFEFEAPEPQWQPGDPLAPQSSSVEPAATNPSPVQSRSPETKSDVTADPPPAPSPPTPAPETQARQPTRPKEPRQSTPPPASGGQDIETLYKKGLISEEDYEKLSSFFKQTGEG